MRWHRTPEDKVTPELRAAVFDRDREAVADELAMQGFTTEWRGDRLIVGGTKWGAGAVVCPAILVDVQLFGTCKGRWELDHVKRAARLGLRAESTMATLISLCDAHTEPGMKAGFQWNTANRPALRTLLERLNG